MGKWLKKHFLTMIIMIVMLVGIGLLLYPSVANYWNQFHQTRAIMAYNDTVSSLSTEDYEKILNDAKEYNKKLGETGIVWKMSKAQKAEYEKQLAVDSSGIMGYVSVPKFHIKLPVYHGTNESVLQIAIGHLEQTSLPVGGESSHCEVSGHRGLPSARLFTDIDKIKEGDTWLKLEIIEGVYGYAHTKLFTLAEGYAAVSDAEPKAVEQEEEKTTYVTPSVNVLDIYASESNESDIVATVEYGAVLELISKGEDWSKVKTLDGEEGYVIASDIETTTYDPDSAYVEVVNKFVNLRAEASVDSEKLGSLNQGETAEYLGEEDGFYKVKTEDGTEGYVSMDYTRLNNGSGDSAADDAENEEDE